MEKISVKIEDFEDKKAANGTRYTRFKTSDGWMSCFDKKTIEALKQLEGETVSLNITVDEEKGWKNIKGLVGKAESDGKPLKAIESERKPLLTSNDYEPTSMYVSYAKDIFVALLESTPKGSELDVNDVMRIAIDRVIQAKKAFE